MIRLDAATVLLQWAVGGLFFLWVTGRRREVGVGYGWLLRGSYLLVAAGSLAAASVIGWVPARDVAAGGVVVATAVALGVSIVRRKAGPTGYPAHLDLVAPAIGAVGLVAGALDAGGNDFTALLRTLAGAAFLGVVSDAMLLGHWYLVQPGLTRAPLLELVRCGMLVWPLEVAALFLPTGMTAVWSGEIDDGYNGLLGWFWLPCAVGTLILFLVTRAALRERSYSAVMAATGLLYLAILTAFGTDLVARAVLAA